MNRQGMNAEVGQTIDLLLRGKGTNHYGDRLCHAALLRAYRGRAGFAYLRRAIMAQRRGWLAWRIGVQRDWQNANRNGHHDSFELRERYIAAHVDSVAEGAYMARARAYNRARKPGLFAKVKYANA